MRPREKAERIDVAERALWVTGRLGLHARAAANLVRVANQFQSDITLKRLDNSVEADAKSILSILMLAASRGTELRVLAAGPDEQAAVEAVFDLFVRNFDERVLTESRQTDTKEEIRCKGLGVSEGVVIGRVLRLQDGTREVYRAEIEESELERERRRFRAAVRLSRRQLEARNAVAHVPVHSPRSLHDRRPAYHPEDATRAQSQPPLTHPTPCSESLPLCRSAGFLLARVRRNYARTNRRQIQLPLLRPDQRRAHAIRYRGSQPTLECSEWIWRPPP